MWYRILWWIGPCFCSGSWVDDILKHIFRNHLQVLEGLLFLLFDLPLFFFGSLFCFCNRCDGYLVILADFFGVLPLLAREEGEDLFREYVAGVAV